MLGKKSAGRLMEVKNHIINTLGTAKRWPQLLNRGGRWIEVSKTTVYWQINRDFGKWPLNGGWLLNRRPLNRGRTVSQIKLNTLLTRDVKEPTCTLKLITKSSVRTRNGQLPYEKIGDVLRLAKGYQSKFLVSFRMLMTPQFLAVKKVAFRVHPKK